MLKSHTAKFSLHWFPVCTYSMCQCPTLYSHFYKSKTHEVVFEASIENECRKCPQCCFEITKRLAASFHRKCLIYSSDVPIQCLLDLFARKSLNCWKILFFQGNCNYSLWLFSQVKCKENDNKPRDKQWAPAENIEKKSAMEPLEPLYIAHL